MWSNELKTSRRSLKRKPSRDFSIHSELMILLQNKELANRFLISLVNPWKSEIARIIGSIGFSLCSVGKQYPRNQRRFFATVLAQNQSTRGRRNRSRESGDRFGSLTSHLLPRRARRAGNGGAGSEKNRTAVVCHVDRTIHVRRFTSTVLGMVHYRANAPACRDIDLILRFPLARLFIIASYRLHHIPSCRLAPTLVSCSLTITPR